MHIAVFGLGKMGAQIARRLHKKGFEVLAWNRSKEPRDEVSRAGVKTFADVPSLITAMPDKPRIFWLMLPSGVIGDFLQNQLGSFLKAGDIVIDGGNTFYKESIKRAKELGEKGVVFYDCGTSGGVWGEENGFALMVGGPK
jgi:6-phosphogluconate dehydrogenase